MLVLFLSFKLEKLTCLPQKSPFNLTSFHLIKQSFCNNHIGAKYSTFLPWSLRETGKAFSFCTKPGVCNFFLITYMYKHFFSFGTNLMLLLYSKPSKELLLS